MPAVFQLQKKYQALLALDFLLLLTHATGKTREWLVAHPEYQLSLIKYLKFRWYYYQRRRGVPVAYFTHHKEFFGLDFFVNKHVLIPRPDTELMVEEVLQTFGETISLSGFDARRRHPEASQPRKAKGYCLPESQNILIDVGTGSGCIPIAILKNTDKKITAFATDISRRALRVAKANARTQNVFINFLHGDLLEPILKQKEKILKNAKQITITANLPYLTKEQFQNEPSIQKEPYSALVANNEGLALYEQLLKQIQLLLLPTPYPLLAFLEIDPSQSTQISTLIKKYLPTSSTEIKPDLAGHNRLVIIKN